MLPHGSGTVMHNEVSLLLCAFWPELKMVELTIVVHLLALLRPRFTNSSEQVKHWCCKHGLMALNFAVTTAVSGRQVSEKTTRHFQGMQTQYAIATAT